MLPRYFGFGRFEKSERFSGDRLKSPGHCRKTENAHIRGDAGILLFGIWVGRGRKGWFPVEGFVGEEIFGISPFIEKSTGKPFLLQEGHAFPDFKGRGEFVVQVVNLRLNLAMIVERSRGGCQRATSRGILARLRAPRTENPMTFPCMSTFSITRSSLVSLAECFLKEWSDFFSIL